MFGFDRRSAGEIAEDLWATDLECQSANERHWATGRPPTFSRLARRAADLDSELCSLDRKLRRRAGDLAGVPVAALAEMEPTDAVVAAAALRVVDTDVFLEDTESLQPGVELPAVGYYARRLSSW